MVEERQESVAPILLVEDQANDAWLVRRALELAEVQNPLIVATDGEEAIEILSSSGNGGRPCLVVTDLEMPGVDGLELLRWLKHRPEFLEMPRVVMSTSVVEENVARAMQLGARAYYVKPSSHTGLMQLVLQWKEMFGLRAPVTV